MYVVNTYICRFTDTQWYVRELTKGIYWHCFCKLCKQAISFNRLSQPPDLKVNSNSSTSTFCVDRNIVCLHNSYHKVQPAPQSVRLCITRQFDHPAAYVFALARSEPHRLANAELTQLVTATCGLFFRISSRPSLVYSVFCFIVPVCFSCLFI